MTSTTTSPGETPAVIPAGFFAAKYRGRHCRPRHAIAVALGAILALGAIACGSSPEADTNGWPGDQETTSTTAPTAKKAAGVTDGQHAVGEDIKAGTYTTTVPADGHCYWARLKDFDGELNSILSNGNLEGGAKGRIVVKKSDGGVELSGGCTWMKK